MTIENTKFKPYIAIHPGEHLADILDGANMSQKELSDRIGITKETVNDIINGRNPVSPETAIKLERVFGISATFWNNLQTNYEETFARLEDQRSLAGEAEIARRYGCYNELSGYGIVKKTRDWAEKTKELMKFFQVASLGAVPNTEPIAFRKTHNQHISKECLAVWLRIGEVDAIKQELPEFDKAKLKELIPTFRQLTLEKPEIFSKRLKGLCNSCGVAIVYTPYISKTYANGATRWVGNNPLIQLSLRYKYSDIFWFTFFHELAHILKHGKKDQYIEIQNSGSTDENEKEADHFACEVLIPGKEYKEFVSQKIMTRSSALAFAQKIGISPEIIAGRLGHDTGNWAAVHSLRKQLTLSQGK